jgi:hypothetical protein
LFKSRKESRRFSVIAGDNFNFDDIVDKIHPAIFPGSLIRRGLGANGEGAKDRDQFLANSFEFFRLDLTAVIIF